MSDLGYVAFEIEAPVGSGGSTKTGRFEIFGSAAGEYEFQESIQNEPLVDSRFSQLISILKDLAAPGSELYKGITIDRGGGVHTIEVRFENPGDTEKPGGTVCQWGSSADPADGPNAHTATGGTKKQQQAVLMNYLLTSSSDSLTPATLYYNERHSGGFMPPLDVSILDPQTAFQNTNPSRYSNTLTFVSVKDLNTDDGTEATKQSTK